MSDETLPRSEFDLYRRDNDGRVERAENALRDGVARLDADVRQLRDWRQNDLERAARQREADQDAAREQREEDLDETREASQHRREWSWSLGLGVATVAVALAGVWVELLTHR